MESENFKEMDILLKELCDNIIEESDEGNKENDEKSQVETKSDLEADSCVNRYLILNLEKEPTGMIVGDFVKVHGLRRIRLISKSPNLDS